MSLHAHSLMSFQIFLNQTANKIEFSLYNRAVLWYSLYNDPIPGVTAMKLFEIYKYTAMLLSFFIGLCIFAYTGTILRLIGAVLFFAIFVTLIILRRSEKLRDHATLTHSFILMSAALSLACVISFISLDGYAAGFEKYEGKSDRVSIRITACDYSLSYTSRYKAVVLESELIPRGTKIFVNTAIGYLDDGTILSGEITYYSLDEMSSSSFDAKRYYMTQKIMLSSDDVSLSVTGSDNVLSINSIFSAINKKLSAMVSAHTGKESGGLASAVLLGNRDNLDEGIERDFRRLGISHLLVVSGSHFAVIVSFITYAMRYTPLKRRHRAICNIFLIFLIMGITGFTPSVMRAGVMHIISQISTIVTRRANTINSFALSGVIIVLLNPFSVLDCGLQLSFAATYGCILYQRMKSPIYVKLKRKFGFSPRKNPMLRFIFGILETIAMTTVVTVFTLPLIWIYFGEVSLLSIPANVVFIPLITALMYLTGIYLILYPLRLFIVPLAALINSCCVVVTGFAGFLSSGENVMISVNYDFTPLFFVPITFILVIVTLLPKKARLVSLSAACVLCVSFFAIIGISSCLDRDNVYITYIGENKNDGFVLKSQGKVIICEISDASFGYSYNLTDEVGEMNVCEIEAVLMTHYHNKHVQLLGRLCEREMLRCVYLPEPIDEREEGLYSALVEKAEYYGIECFTIPCGDSFTFGDADITVFERKYLSRSTHPITAVEISACGEEVVILSNSFNESYDEITAAAESAEYLFFGRHSPVYKKTFGLSFDNLPKVIGVCDAAYEYMDDVLRGTLDAVECVINPEVYRIKLTHNE